jgi:hypothetical protein
MQAYYGNYDAETTIRNIVGPFQTGKPPCGHRATALMRACR